MNRSKSLLLYKEEPASGVALKTIVGIVPAALFVGSLSMWAAGKSSGSLNLMIEAVAIGIIFWVVLPRRYEVYEDRLRIVLGGPFAFNIGFNHITKVEVSSRTRATINFVTGITKKYVVIERMKGLSVAITPRNNDLFLENAVQALNQWKNHEIDVHPRTSPGRIV